MKNALIYGLALVLSSLNAGELLAQGQDSTIAERDIMIMGELFPGFYDNANQAYFDVRLKAPKDESHTTLNKEVHRIEASGFGDYVFWAKEVENGNQDEARFYLYTLDVDNDVKAVRMKTYELDSAPNDSIAIGDANYLNKCDLLWRQEAGHFRGKVENSRCKLGGRSSEPKYEMLLSDQALWQTLPGKDHGIAPNYFAMDRARSFECYMDVPGVGGGRDIPFKRYELGDIHDLGGKKWITTDDGQQIGVSMFRVIWPMNNYEGQFARPSFVIYVSTRDDEGVEKEVSYSWTSPDAQRIGINLKWMLASCSMIPSRLVKPFSGIDEPKI